MAEHNVLAFQRRTFAVVLERLLAGNLSRARGVALSWPVQKHALLLCNFLGKRISHASSTKCRHLAIAGDGRGEGFPDSLYETVQHAKFVGAELLPGAGHARLSLAAEQQSVLRCACGMSQAGACARSADLRRIY